MSIPIFIWDYSMVPIHTHIFTQEIVFKKHKESMFTGVVFPKILFISHKNFHINQYQRSLFLYNPLYIHTYDTLLHTLVQKKVSEGIIMKWFCQCSLLSCASAVQNPPSLHAECIHMCFCCTNNTPGVFLFVLVSVIFLKSTLQYSF